MLNEQKISMHRYAVIVSELYSMIVFIDNNQ